MAKKNNAPEWRRSEELSQMESQLFPHGFTLRDEANAIVAMAFRSCPIEHLHAWKPSELLSAPELSRMRDDEMKTLMINWIAWKSPPARHATGDTCGSHG